MATRLSPHRAYPAASEFAHFATQLVQQLQATDQGWLYGSNAPTRLSATREDRKRIELDLTPFQAPPFSADAKRWFSHVNSLTQLISAYRQAKASCIQEPHKQVHPYAAEYLESRFEAAQSQYSAEDAQRIAQWVSQLDVYAAVKAVECLIDCRDNLTLFEIADQHDWLLLFDHLAIRCGSGRDQQAEQLTAQLQSQHGYVQSQVESERFYQFEDGWNASPLYKMLDNGQVIRLFIDQSDAADHQQIIQHWNHCYGFTAHHLALRAVKVSNGCCHAVPLKTFIEALNQTAITTLTATGFYTQGLLEQVFLKPHINPDIPADILRSLRAIDPKLSRSIQNGKLIELVSRRELPAALVEDFFSLYGLPAHKKPVSTPIYPYFLPAQAAHVIRTSIGYSARED